MANPIIISVAIAVARTVITVSRLWITLFVGFGGIFVVRWYLGLWISEPDIVGWEKAVACTTTLAALIVGLMPRYFVRKYSIIHTACILLCVIAIGGIIVDYILVLREPLIFRAVEYISGLLVILVELICLKKFFVIETSPLPDDSPSSIDRLILGVLLFLTVFVSAYTILSLGGTWVRYLNRVHMFLTVCVIGQYIGIWVSSHKEGVSLTSYPYPWRRIHKSLCTLNLAIGIIGHHVILTSIPIGIWINGYPAGWLL